MKAKVTERTRTLRARRFAEEADKAYKALKAFVDTRCRHRSGRERDEAMEALSEVVDAYIDLNYRILAWCHRNNVPVADFVCTVLNAHSPVHTQRRSHGRVH